MANRRDFLRLVSAGTCGALVHKVLSPSGSMMAFAGPPTAPAVGPRPVLVLVGLNGGVSYNITPLYNGAYRDRNPTISYGAENSHPVNATQGLHPSLTGLRTVYSEGKLALVNLVGYPDPNRSHSESMDIWQSGYRTATGAQGGWAPRLTCQIASTFAGISLSGGNTLVQGECNPPRALGDLSNFGENGFWGGQDGTDWLRMIRSNVILDQGAPGPEPHAFVRNSMLNLDQSLVRLKDYTNISPPNSFPNHSFGRRCRDAARLLMAGAALDTRIIYLEQGGFDTHEDERQVLPQLLREVDEGLSALIATAKAIGRWQDLVIATFSEFSRTHENGSRGTDHGHAVPMLITGGAIRGGVLTQGPTTAEINAGDYFRTYRIDFRQIFGELIAGMRLNASTVFPEGYNPAGHIGLYS